MLGAATWNYGLVVFVLIPIGLLLGWAQWLSWTGVIYFCVAAAFVGPVIMYPFSWSLWIMTYYLLLPYELPVNQKANAAFDEDE